MFICFISSSQREIQNECDRISQQQRQERRKSRLGNPKIRQRLSLRQAALEGEKNQVGTTAHAELDEQVRNVKLHGALGDIELTGDLFVRKVFEKRIENFLLTAAEIGDGVGLQAAALAGEDGIDESGEKLAPNPKGYARDEWESTDQLFASF